MNIAQDDLNRWRSSCGRLRVTCREALKNINAGRVQQARQFVEETEEAAREMAMQLERAGADRPDAPPPSFESGVPLHLLDTPTNRRYLEVLGACYAAALAVDRERYGEDIGTDGRAQTIGRILADVAEEVGGPVGLGEGVKTQDIIERTTDAGRPTLEEQLEEQEISAKQALFDLFDREMREVAFSQAQSDTASWGLRSLDAGDLEGVRNALHILRAGASHKLAVHHADIPPGSIPFELDQAAQEIGGFASADPAATAAAIRAFLAACEKAKALAGEMQIVSPYLDSLIFLLEKDIAIFNARQAE